MNKNYKISSEEVNSLLPDGLHMGSDYPHLSLGSGGGGTYDGVLIHDSDVHSYNLDDTIAWGVCFGIDGITSMIYDENTRRLYMHYVMTPDTRPFKTILRGIYITNVLPNAFKVFEEACEERGYKNPIKNYKEVNFDETPIDKAKSCYMMLEANNEGEMLTLVEAHVALGYLPQGGISMTPQGIYLQAVFRNPNIK